MIRRGWFVVLTLGVLVIVLIAVGLAFLRTRVATSRLPERGQSMQRVAGCPALAEILFDASGAPHIYSGSDSALWFTQGYLHARDRFFQMDLARRTANGRLAELLGEMALESDRKMRILRLAPSARGQAALLTAYERRVLELYADGVNAAIEEYGSWIAPEVWLLGLKPERWSIEDSLVSGLFFQLNSSSAMGREVHRAVLLSRLGRDRAVDLWGWTQSEARAWIPPGDNVSQPVRDDETISGRPTGSGSNAWMISSERSATGRALLAADVNLSVQMPSTFFPIHLSGPGLEVAGVSIAGIPGVVVGHTREVAWSLTSSMMDDQDLFVLTLDDLGSRELIDGRWRPLRTVTENISVRWQSDPVLVKVRLSVHGPVVRNERGDSLALAWSGLSGPSALRAILGMNRAQTAVGVAESWESIVSPSMNLLAADTGGTILHQVVGQVPERLRGAGRLPAPGADSNWAWKGFLPMASNPRMVDPPGGSLVVAGHDLFAEGEYPPAQAFPAEFAPPWRARRIKSLLAKREVWTVEDCLDLQRDLVSTEAIAVLKQLRPDLEQQDGPVARELMAWDATMDAASNAASLYSQFMLELGDAIGGDEAIRLSLARTPLDREEILRLLAGGLDESWWDDVSVEGRQTRTDVIKTVLDRLDDAPAPGRWGNVHTVLFAHPLTWIPRAGSLLVGTWNRGPYRIGGDRSTLNTEDWNRREPFAVTSLPAMRFVTEVGNWDATVLGVPTGQSGRPWSGHYADQIERWLAVDPPVFPFTREAVDTAATARLRLVPRSARVPVTEAVR